MDAYVGAEYMITNALIVLSREKSQNYISISQIRSVGVQFQQYCNKNGIDAVIMTSGLNISNVINGFSDYFEYIEPAVSGYEPVIRVRKNVSISRLQQRFVGYMPPKVLRAILTELPKFVL